MNEEEFIRLVNSAYSSYLKAGEEEKKNIIKTVVSAFAEYIGEEEVEEIDDVLNLFKPILAEGDNLFSNERMGSKNRELLVALGSMYLGKIFKYLPDELGLTRKLFVAYSLGVFKKGSKPGVPPEFVEETLGNYEVAVTDLGVLGEFEKAREEMIEFYRNGEVCNELEELINMAESRIDRDHKLIEKLIFRAKELLNTNVLEKEGFRKAVRKIANKHNLPEDVAEAIVVSLIVDTYLEHVGEKGEYLERYKKYLEVLKRKENAIRRREAVLFEVEEVDLEEADGKIINLLLNSRNSEDAAKIVVNIAKNYAGRGISVDGELRKKLEEAALQFWEHFSSNERALIAALTGGEPAKRLDAGEIETYTKFLFPTNEIKLSGVPWEVVEKAMEADLGYELVYNLLTACEEAPKNTENIPEKYLSLVASYVVDREIAGRNSKLGKGTRLWRYVNEILIWLGKYDEVSGEFIEENPQYRWVKGRSLPKKWEKFPLPRVKLTSGLEDLESDWICYVPVNSRVVPRYRIKEVWLSYGGKHYQVFDDFFVTPDEKNGIEVVEGIE